jgi:quercetin dioxygenase-like cupin family protein
VYRVRPEVAEAWRRLVAARGRVQDGSVAAELGWIFDGDGPGDHWERHPAGDELVVCLTGSVTVTRDLDGVPARVLLGPGEATVNPAGVWHAVDMTGPASILTITAGLGTDHRPRTGTPPTGRAGAPGPEAPSRRAPPASATTSPAR